MILQEVLSDFERQMPNRTVFSVFQPSNEYLVIIAPLKGDTSFDTPNAFMYMADRRIMEISPIQDIKLYSEATKPENQIYNRFV